MDNEQPMQCEGKTAIEKVLPPKKSKIKNKMKLKNFTEKIKTKKKPMSKRVKANITATVAVLLIGCAVMLNWLVFSKVPEADPVSEVAAETSDKAADDSDSFFTESQIIRQRARDESIEVLQSIIYSEDALEDVKSEAWSDINSIAKNIEAEANIESLVVSKGIKECVAVISDGAASVIVKSDGLTQDQITQIQEIVYEQAQIPVENLKIIEK